MPLSFIDLTSLPSLFSYWRNAKHGKSKSLRVQRFGDDALRYLLKIQDQLRTHTYTFGPYKTFTVREKKFRHVVDAPMKDRVVHWLLYQYLLPIWQPRFIHDTYGNLPGRGTHAAVQRLAQFARRPANTWVLQVDISKYFYSVIAAALAAGQSIAEMPANMIDAALDKTDPTQVDLIKVLKSTESEK